VWERESSSSTRGSMTSRPRQRHPLLLPARLRLTGRGAVPATAPRLPGAPVGAGVALGAAHAARLQPEGHVLAHRQVREQRVVLEHDAEAAPLRGHARDVGAVEQHRAGVGALVAGGEAERGGLAGARRADEGQQLAGRQRERQPVERRARGPGVPARERAQLSDEAPIAGATAPPRARPAGSRTGAPAPGLPAGSCRNRASATYT
jgi:hypothetical protein